MVGQPNSERISSYSLAISDTSRVDRLLDDLRGIRRPAAPPAGEPSDSQPRSEKPEMEHLRERLILWFREWVNIYQRTPTPEKSFIPYITTLTKQGILKAEEVSLFFFRVCAETSIKSYITCATSGDYANAYHALDAMSRLITYIIKYHGDASGVNNDNAKVHYLTKILSIFVLVLAKEHEERGVHFPQKPFFRFFSTLINDLHAIEGTIGTAYLGLLFALRCTARSPSGRSMLIFCFTQRRFQHPSAHLLPRLRVLVDVSGITSLLHAETSSVQQPRGRNLS
jgi:CCR4-NOT transcription complex subunit 1